MVGTAKALRYFAYYSALTKSMRLIIYLVFEAIGYDVISHRKL